MKSIYQQTNEILTNNTNVKIIFNYINEINYKNCNLICEHFIDMIAKNSNDFTKDIATKFINGSNLTEKQAWCLSYQIINNINVYFTANKEEEEISKKENN